MKSINFKSYKFLPNLKKTLNLCFKDILKHWPKNLPQGIIHGDLFIDNIFSNIKTIFVVKICFIFAF